ncbi:hypothetical protein [Hydrogenophaga sp. BPS33]|uniref:hypothetical protein n=1 Tax=Hydrogenophaga sp. BPS33 TaxID=2651974 RepID=UPI00131FE458|nr:hypothetical protein [Hydrogenophaga sp. BPS33]QHE88191.1 DUF1566 domain-containing protein [Hydrogenophaga sp. BPS33]
MFVRHLGLVSILACVSLSLSACGGGGNPPEAVLSVSVSELALAARQPAALPSAIPGTPRVLTVTNTSTHVTAQNVALDPAVVLPADTTVVGDCGTLAPLESCSFTVTPGAAATTAPVALPIRGSNTNTVTPTVQVLTYGSLHQGGYVFALDDTTPDTGSVGGKVMARREEAAYPAWSTNADAMAGVDELSVAPCVGASDGACNTATVVKHYEALRDSPLAYAAGRCSAFIDEGYDDWYLPSVCEMGVDDNGSASGCGSRAAPRQQNIFLNLVKKGYADAMVPSVYWTSTASSTAPAGQAPAWVQQYSIGGDSNQLRFDRVGSSIPVRCVRAFRP